MTTPMVSVVMSVFNGERFLREAVESILDQSFRDFEFVIIDDGSNDRSGSILDFYESSDARVKVHHQDHRGLIESLNRGCNLAQGKYIARMDADDVACKDRLMWQVEFMETHPEIAVLGGAVEWINAVGKQLGVHSNPAEDRKIREDLLRRCPLWHPTVLLRREAFVSAGGYRRPMADAEDYDLWLRISDNSQFANLERVVLKYRIHASQVSMRKRASQTLCMLAAQVAASSRKNGLLDPLNTVEEITPEFLAGLGVTKASQQREFASDCENWIRNMINAGEYAAALKAAIDLLDSDLQYVEKWKIANLHLTVALLYWKQRRFAKSIVATIHALLVRPAIVGRPLKLLVQ